MGVCASCLGLNRRPSQEIDETDPLLDDEQAQYGGTAGGDVSQPDEEELRREREAFDHITTEATDNMIDVLHPDTTELSQRFAHRGSQRGGQTPAGISEDASAAQGDGESKWLQGIQATGADMTAVKGLEAGTLVIDPSQLRVGPPTSAPRGSTKGKLPA